jgi:hypothetical protein
MLEVADSVLVEDDALDWAVGAVRIAVVPRLTL